MLFVFGRRNWGPIFFWPSPMEAMMGCVGGGGKWWRRWERRNAAVRWQPFSAESATLPIWVQSSSTSAVAHMGWAEAQLPIWVQGPEAAHCPSLPAQLVWPISPLSLSRGTFWYFQYCPDHQADIYRQPSRISQSIFFFLSVVHLFRYFLVFIVTYIIQGWPSYCWCVHRTKYSPLQFFCINCIKCIFTYSEHLHFCP